MITITRFLSLIGYVVLIGTAFSQQAKTPILDNTQSYEYQLLTKGVDIPWGMAWLDVKTILVTDRKDEQRVINNGIWSPKSTRYGKTFSNR